MSGPLEPPVNPGEQAPALIPLGDSDSAVCEDGFCVVPPAPAEDSGGIDLTPAD